LVIGISIHSKKYAKNAFSAKCRTFRAFTQAKNKYTLRSIPVLPDRFIPGTTLKNTPLNLFPSGSGPDFKEDG
jgi:hypothetical protein